MTIETLNLSGFDYRHMPSSRENLRDAWHGVHSKLFSPKNVLVTCAALTAIDIALESHNLSHGYNLHDPMHVAASFWNIGGIVKNFAIAGVSLHSGYRAADPNLGFASYAFQMSRDNLTNVWGALQQMAGSLSYEPMRQFLQSRSIQELGL
jgi:hypothetical protein